MQHNSINTGQVAYSRHRSEHEIDQCVTTHGPLVRKIAWHVHSRMSSAIEIEDLIQIGLIALVEAARNFEERGVDFVPYARMRVRGAMIDQLRRDARMSRSGMANRRILAETKNRFQQQFGRTANDAETAQALGLNDDAYMAMVKSSMADRQDSLDDHYTDHAFWFADLSDSADTQIEKAELQQALATHIGNLSEREALILQLYFTEELNLDEIGAVLGVGAARICQIKKAALDKLRVQMAE